MGGNPFERSEGRRVHAWPTQCELFDDVTGIWTKLPDITTMRNRYPGIAVVRRGECHRIYVFGGDDNNWITLNSCEFLDIGEKQSEWSRLPDKMATCRRFTSAVILDRNTIVVCGGDMGDKKGLASCEALDLATHTFSQFPDMLEGRRVHAGVHYNGTIVVIGGVGSKTCEQFDPSSLKWTPIASLDEERHDIGAAVIENMIYIAGDNCPYIEAYNGVVWSVVVVDVPTPRDCGSVIALSGKLVVIGGTTGEIDVFDVDTRAWSKIPRMFQFRRTELAVVSF